MSEDRRETLAEGLRRRAGEGRHVISKSVDHVRRKAEYEAELDAYIAAVKRQGGPEMTRSEVHYILFMERKAAAEEAARSRESEARRILAQIRTPRATDEPDWHRADEWVREDFIRAVAWDQDHGGRGGRISLARRCPGMSASALYRRWRKVAPNEAWPSGNNGPLNRM